MARVQYGVIVTSLKGNIGGQTFQNGNTAKVLRSKGYRKGSLSVKRKAQNLNIISSASAWRTIFQSDRELWATARTNWPFKDKFGNTYYGSGYQMYVAYNTALKLLGFPSVTDPDVPLSANDPGSVSIGTWNNTAMQITWSGTIAIDQFLHATFQILDSSLHRSAGV